MPRFAMREPKLVLHLYSGRRRRGDGQHWIEALAPDRNLFVLSVDVALSKEHGDLSDSRTVARWRDLLSTGRVLAVIAGPPCESWSTARHVALTRSSFRPPPRPLRSLVEPWGMAGVSAKEQEQLSTANTLLQVALLFCADCLRLGATCIIEHPSTATWRESASIWRLPEVQALADHPSAEVVQLHQGAFGARSLKPTTLLCANLPEVRLELDRLPHRGLVTEQRGLHASIGTYRDATGRHQFHTHRSRSIPSTAILRRWWHVLHEWAPDIDLPDEYSTVYAPLDPFYEFTMGKDYQARQN